MTTLAENLKRLRREREMTQVQLAEASGLKQSAISLYESGSDMPEVSSLLKLATGLRTPLESLVQGVDMRFDLVYQGLKATVTTEDERAGEMDLDTAPATLPSNIPLEQIMPGYTADLSVEPNDPPETLAPPETVLDRIMAELLTLRGRIVSRSDSVADRRRSSSSDGPVRRSMGSTAKARKKTTARRRRSTRKAR